MISLEATERIDNIGFKNLRLIQKPEDFCYGIDAVALAHFAATNAEHEQTRRLKHKLAFDLGTGTGIIPLILSHKTDIEKIYGIELQNDSYNRALRNIQINELESRIGMYNGDVSKIKEMIPEKYIGTTDLVTANPPYMAGDSGIKNTSKARMIARHETSGSLEDFICAASILLKDKGDFYMVHRPERLVDICTFARKHKIEPKGIRFVSPRSGEKPNILLIHFVKNGNPSIKFMNNLNVYEDGQYSKEINSIYEK